MSVASPAVLPEPRVARLTPRSGRLGLLFAVILVTSVSAFALSVVSFAKPIGDGDALPGYATIAPERSYVWAFFVVAAVQLIVGACAAALAVLVLVPRRGGSWATVGASLVWIGAAVYGVGVGGWAAVYFYASDPGALDPAVATRLIDHVNDDTMRMLAVPLGGALMVALGSLVLAVALWRARTVPRWLPIAGALGALATIVVPPSTTLGLVAEAASSATTVAVGYYAWQLSR